MGEESPKPASGTPMGAVFLSYASQDAAAAQKICEALRAAGIEVWFDQTELRGGDAWDRKIRQRIHECRLFIAVISAHTDERDEGYFRREWKLAVDRTHDMAEDKAFVVPVAIDGTSERSARVPDSFKHVHWTRLPEGETPRVFVEWVRRLVSPELSHGQTSELAADRVHGTVTTTNKPVRSFSRSKSALPVMAVVVLAASVAYFAVEKFWVAKHESPPPSPLTAPTSMAPAAFTPPPHSIAVLPFVNLSGDKEQEYFSDGLSEELLNDLARINELQVAARTSAFSFKGKDADISTIGRKLNVGSVLEGSVRRSGRTIRITAQLNNAVTGFHIWSQTYDRDLGDMLQLQTEIATAVAAALKVTLLGDVAAKIEAGGTHSPAAFDAYLRASKTWALEHGAKERQAAIASYDEAIRLDPKYALALADRSLALTAYATLVTGQSTHDAIDKANADARKAIELAPDLAESHLALAFVLQTSLDFRAADKEYERALALGPGNARLLRIYGPFAVNMGWTDAGLAALRHGVVLDPLSRKQHTALGDALANIGRFAESTAAYREALTIDPDDSSTYVNIGINYLALGDLQNAQTWCVAKPEDRNSSACLALIYDKLGRHSDAEAALAKYRNSSRDIFPYVNALIYAQWGDTTKALPWLEKAMRVRDSNLQALKVDPFLDPLRQEPRFQAMMRELKFPD